jgi:raffinose/stachyose/melibiose transport system permease protein
MNNTAFKKSPTKISLTVVYLLLTILAILFLFPIVWVFFASFKDNTSLLAQPWALPNPIQFQNYTTAWVSGKIGQYFVHSLIVSGATLLLNLFFSSMAAYAISRMKWKLSKTVMSVFLIGMMVPIHATLIPLYLIFSKIGLINSFMGLIIPYMVFAFPTTIYILSSFFSSLPRDIEEAAVIDGCGLWKVFWEIIIPISTPGLFTVSIFGFVASWNELLVALIFTTGDNVKTLPVGLSNFVGTYSTNYAPMLAAIVLAMFPTILIYCMFSNKIIGGMTAGAVKG